jgi:O-antigen/teichoic acid export membrane protein
MTMCNITKIMVQIGVTPVLAHIIGPRDFGLYSLALPSITFVMMLADGGLGQTLAREPEDHDATWSSAFWLLLGLGLLMALAVCAWSFPLAWIAHEQQLPPIMISLSLCVVLMTLSVTPSARLTRRGHIRDTAIIDLAANLVGSSLAIGFALLGAGVWSLAAQFISLYLVRAVGVNSLAFRRPQLVFNWKMIAPHTMVGGTILITKFAESIGRMLEPTFISRRFGTPSLGAYSLASQAAWSVAQSVNNPAGTALFVRALREDDPAELEQLHLRMIRVIALTTLPVTAIIAGAAPRLISDLLGEKWAATAFVMACIFPSQAVGTLGQLYSSVLYANGRTMTQTWITIGYSMLRVAAVAIPFGNWQTVPSLIAAANLAYFVVGVANAKFSLDWSMGRILRDLRGPAIASLLAAGTAAGLSHAVEETGLWVLVMVLGGAFAAFCVSLTICDLANVRRDVTMIQGFLVSHWPAPRGRKPAEIEAP